MKRNHKVTVVALSAVVVVAGLGVYWEWLRPLPRTPASACPSSGGGLGGAPPVIFALSSPASWTWSHGSDGYSYNATFEYVVPTASTNWTGLDLINRTFTHSLIGYTVTLRNATLGAEAVFNSSDSNWRAESGSTPSEALVNWTPTIGTPIVASDTMQFQSESNLTASGLYITMAMAAGECGPWEEEQFIL